MEFVDRVLLLLDSKGKTRKEITMSAGIAPNSFVVWKKRGTIPPADVAVLIAKELNTTVEYLVTGEQPDRINSADRAYLEAARRYQPVVSALDQMPEIARDCIINGIMANASIYRQKGAIAAG